MAAGKATGGELAATWRNPGGEIVASTFGGTMCWMPKRPWSLRISRDDYTAIVPCGECPGCLEFYRRRLGDRLRAKYREIEEGAIRRSGRAAARGAESTTPSEPALYLIRIYAPIERHAVLSRLLHRRRCLELEPGFIRLGASSFAVLSRERAFSSLSLQRAGLRFTIEPIRFSRGRRAWRTATSGMLVARDAYGEDLNRWYLRGLPPAEKESWDVRTKSGAKGYSRASSPRVWKSGNLVLVPPEIWRLGRADRRTLRRDLGSASSPEEVARVVEKVAELVARKVSSPLIGPAARPVSNGICTHSRCPADRCLYLLDDKRVSASPQPSPSSPTPEGGRGYVSSVHLAGTGPPESPPAAGTGPWTPVHLRPLPEDSLTELSHKQREHRRIRKELDASLERLRKKLTGGS